MRYFSTFSGIGGFEHGIAKAYARKKSEAGASSNGDGRLASGSSERESVPVCVGFSEIDSYATRIYQKHYPSHKNYGDITKLDPADLPDIDAIVGGFPCQSFSFAGNRRGIDDARGTLFFEVARIAEAKKPRLLFLENVKGLLSSGHRNTGIFYDKSSGTYSAERRSDGDKEITLRVRGETYFQIQHTLSQLDYLGQSGVLNSKDFGVPQNRERTIIVGHLRGTSSRQIFPLAGSHSEDYGGALQATYGKGGHDGTYPVASEAGTLRTHKDGQGFRRTASGLVPTIPARARQDGSGQPVILQRPRGKNGGGVHEDAPTLSSNEWNHNNHVAYTLKARQDSGIDEKHPQTLVATGVNRPSRGYEPRKDGLACAIKAGESGSKNLMLDPLRLRRLTPVECERLQGFPDGWTEQDGEGVRIADTRRYFALGNAVTTNVIEAVASRLV